MRTPKQPHLRQIPPSQPRRRRKMSNTKSLKCFSPQNHTTPLQFVQQISCQNCPMTKLLQNKQRNDAPMHPMPTHRQNRQNTTTTPKQKPTLKLVTIMATTSLAVVFHSMFMFRAESGLFQRNSHATCPVNPSKNMLCLIWKRKV
jgi:hypothetical protein